MAKSRDICHDTTPLTFILQPYSRVNTENPYPILDLFPDLLMLTGLREVFVLPAVPFFKCYLPGNRLQTKFFKQLKISRKTIPYSRPKLSDFYTLFWSKLAENHTLHSGTYLYSSYMGVTPPPPGCTVHCIFLLLEILTLNKLNTQYFEIPEKGAKSTQRQRGAKFLFELMTDFYTRSFEAIYN